MLQTPGSHMVTQRLQMWIDTSKGPSWRQKLKFKLYIEVIDGNLKTAVN